MRFSVVVAFVIGVAAPAFAHGELEGTSPDDGARLKRVPREIRITLTEAPTPGVEARATDGCKNRVGGTVAVEGNDIVLSVDGGEPGQWSVSYRAVSAEDGHQTRGGLKFTVSGTKHCGDDVGDDKSEDEIDAGGQPGIIENPNPPADSKAWLLWIAGGTVALAAVAYVLRRATR